MTWQELIAIAATFIVSLGGGGAIVLGLAHWIGKIFTDKYVEKIKHELQEELESHKTRLRKSEFLFQKEFEAASAFISLHIRLSPKYRFQKMDSYEACEDFANNFERVENELESYITIHGAALQNETLERLVHAKTIASQGNLEVEFDTVSDKGIQYAEEVIDTFQEIENELYQTVRSQSSGKPDSIVKV